MTPRKITRTRQNSPARAARPAGNGKGASANASSKTAVQTAAKGAKNGRKASAPLAPGRISAILDILAQTYPGVECALHHRNAWELLVATILSAQCTDARVNMVTPALFKKFPSPEDFARAPLPEIEEMIRSTGFYHNKAKSLSGAAKTLIEEFGGKVPQTMAELLRLPGVARKTANVVLGVAFGIAEGIVVDTHVLRLSRRLELTSATDAPRVEQDLTKIIPRDRWIAFSHELIHHGRQVCIARKPRCIDCTLEKLCNSSDKTWGTTTGPTPAQKPAAPAKRG
ncbi:MAG TPA: endonuclease III [Acidobacteriaceae bacterium]|nr:endonuclease III [Acidobacteriaceae bacterium]